MMDQLIELLLIVSNSLNLQHLITHRNGFQCFGASFHFIYLSYQTNLNEITTAYNIQSVYKKTCQFKTRVKRR